MSRTIKTKGSLLVEVVVISAVLLIFVLTLMSAFSFYLNLALSDKYKIQAASLAEEGMEAIRYIRDGSWTTFSSLPQSTPFYIYFSGGTWVTSSVTTNMYVGKFARQVVVSPVYRDASSYSIVSSGGLLDQYTKKVTVTVSWLEKGATTTRELSTYMTNIK